MQTLSSAWHHDHPSEVLNKYTMMPNVAWPASEEVFGNQDLIKTAFRISGIFPWDKSAVHWEKLASGSLYTDKISDDGVELLPAVAEGRAEAAEATLEAMEAEEDIPEAAEMMLQARAAEEGIPEVAENIPKTAEMMLEARVTAEMMLQEVTAAEEGMDVDMEEVRQDDGERFYWQDHQLSVASVDLAEVATQASNNLTGSDLAHFVPADGSNSVDFFPEINHEEKVHLLQR